MEIAVTIEFKGEPGEVGLLLAQLGETLLGDESTDQLDHSWWTPDRAAAFVQELTDPALRALSVIARHAPTVSFRDVQEAMGMSGLQLAGRMSSIGFALARIGGAVPPFDRDYYQRSYYMDPSVATLLSDAIAEEETRRSTTATKRART